MRLLLHSIPHWDPDRIPSTRGDGSTRDKTVLDSITVSSETLIHSLIRAELTPTIAQGPETGRDEYCGSDTVL
jgi:hypothetical protein